MTINQKAQTKSNMECVEVELDVEVEVELLVDEVVDVDVMAL